MGYIETVENLMKLIKQANLADSELAQEWQKPEDARVYFKHLKDALESIAPGLEIFNNWVKNGD